MGVQDQSTVQAVSPAPAKILTDIDRDADLPNLSVSEVTKSLVL